MGFFNVLFASLFFACKDDDMEQLLANLKDDLENAKSNEGAVLEYIEMSPLQQYLKKKQD